MFFDVTFDCINDPQKSTKTEEHADFSYNAVVNMAALTGGNTNTANSSCPRPPKRVENVCEYSANV